MPSYRERVAKDLDGCVAGGLVPESSRGPILTSIPEGARLDAATSLAWVGAVLLGLALIAFISANWDALPRVARFTLVITAFAAATGGAGWCAEHERPNIANALLTIASLVFAAAIGLTGQIFDITGDERTATYAAGAVAVGLGLAGRSSGALIVGLFFIAFGDDWSKWGSGATPLLEIPWLAIASAGAAGMAARWRSAALAHAAAIGLVAASIWIVAKLDFSGVVLLEATAALVALAAAGRWLARRDERLGNVFYGWFVWGAFAAYIGAGIAFSGLHADLTHRIGWLVAAAATVALGRHDRHALVTAAGVLGLIGSVTALMADLGLNPLMAAGVFFVAAIAAIVAGLALRRRAAR